MLNLLLIFIGAGLGGALRFEITQWFNVVLNPYFPYPTLFINVTGCFLIGALFILIFDWLKSCSEALRALVLIGFLGGYTTFSTFSLETLHLIEQAQYGYASANIFLTFFLCLGATRIGIFLAKLFR